MTTPTEIARASVERVRAELEMIDQALETADDEKASFVDREMRLAIGRVESCREVITGAIA